MCYLARLALFIKAGKKRYNVVEELAQNIGSNARRDWKLRRMSSGLSAGSEIRSNHMFASPSQISCMTLAKSFTVLVSHLPTHQIISLVKNKNKKIVGRVELKKRTLAHLFAAS